MRVHLISSLATFEKDLPILKVIVKIIQRKGHTLADDWIGAEHFRLTNGGNRKVDWEVACSRSYDTIERADVVVAEVSGFSCFGVGYQIAYAQQKKKPILLLRNPLKTSESGSFYQGLNDILVTLADYIEAEDAAKCVAGFIDENNTTSKDLRFNFVIDRQIDNHLRWRAYKTGKTKADIIRDLLLRDMNDTGVDGVSEKGLHNTPN